MLLSNARVAGRLVDIRIDDGIITEVGSIGTGDVDLAERFVLPGLWDHHVHFTQWALSSQRLDVSAGTSAAGTAAIVGAAIASDLLVGVGFRDGLWPDAPSREVLDRVSGDVPVVLLSGDLHAAWLNSAALAQFGYPGHETGLLREDDAFTVSKQLSTVPDVVSDGWAKTAADAAARRGVIGVVDLEMGWNFEHWSRRIEAGFDSIRVEFGIYPQHLDRAISEGLRTGQSVNELLTVGRFKAITDGSLNTRTAFVHDTYDDGTLGLLTIPPEQLVPLMRTAVAAGIQPAIHAIGDHANTLVLDAFEEVGGGGRVEHAQLLSDSDLPRFARLGVEVSAQPEHLVDDRDVADRIWPGRTGRAYAFRSLLDAGATLLFGSDAPVAPLDPWVAMAAAVGRTRDGREPWHPEQRVSNAEAIAASVQSSIAVGQPADLVVTELDAYSVSADQLRTMPVAATLLAGRFTHGKL